MPNDKAMTTLMAALAKYPDNDTFLKNQAA
jgi:hypothetical protein